jgi:adenosylcobinamide-GDP ribazoletransferase
MTNRFLGALQFLTVLPIRRKTSSPGEAALFFPLVGAMLGALAASIIRFAEAPLGRPLAAVFAIAFLVLSTGGLHEDGLADAADAFRAGRSRERILEILKDSRIGTYGALALILSLLIRWQALAQGGVFPLAGLSTSLALSRASMVFLGASAPPAGTGLGSAFASHLSRPIAWAVVAEALLFAALPGWRRGLTMVVATFVIVLLARAYFVQRLGGVTGDCLGATCQLVETVNLVILIWQPFY